MTPDPRIHFLGLGFVADEDEVRRRISLARFSGATDAECAEALATWEGLQAESVQRIESQPTPAAACRCSHGHPLHLYGSGRCYSRVCGCRYFREPAPVRPAGDGDIRTYLSEKGELA